MLRIGVTGGIGSGKSTVCRFFENIGVPVFYSDPQAKQLMISSPKLIAALKCEFSDKCYNSDMTLNREFLANNVFCDKKRLLTLNSLIHPAVLEHFDLWCNKQLAQYVVIESAILFDIGWESNVDMTISISAPEHIRIERVIKRDRCSEEEVKRRISKQIKEKDRVAKADFVVHCDEKSLIIPQIIEIDKLIRNEL